MSTHASTDASSYVAPCVDPRESLPPSFRFFRKFWEFLKKLWTEQVKKVRFLFGIPRIPRFRCNFSLPAAKKRKPFKIIDLCTAPNWKFQQNFVDFFLGFFRNLYFCKFRVWKMNFAKFRTEFDGFLSEFREMFKNLTNYLKICENYKFVKFWNFWNFPEKGR